MKLRAAAYNVNPGLLKLVYGYHRIERQLMGVLREAIDPATDPHQFKRIMGAIRNDGFVHLLAKRNRHVAWCNGLYIVVKLRNGILPELNQLITQSVFYVGSSFGIAQRTAAHFKDSISRWYNMGLRVEDGEELYVFRMRITISEQLSVASFDGPDLRRLEQLVIDALGIGTLYNTNPVLSAATMLNDSTYRNHMAPRLNQLALLFFESTHAWLTQHGIADDDRNVWKLPMQDLAEIDAQPPRAVDQGCSPIPTPRISSPEACDFFSRFQAERGFTDEEMADWVLTRKANATASSGHAEHPETNEAPLPSSESVQSDALDQRPDSSLDLFADLYSEEPEEDTPASYGPFDLADEPSTSNGPDYRALEELRDSCAAATASHRAERPEPDEAQMPAGESVQPRIPRQPSPNPPDSLSGSEVSASKIASVKGAPGSVPSMIIRQCTMRIPSYGSRSTQYVDLARAPVDLTQDAPSETSNDVSAQDLSDESLESSDEEHQREILDISSEASLDEPSPTDSGFFDFENVPVVGRKPLNISAKDSVQETTSKDSSTSTTAALTSDDVFEEEAGSSTNDTCAHKNCRRPRSELINWVQCDDCEEWYHSLCIFGAEKAVEEDEFHCGCVKIGKRKPRRAQRSKKQ